MHNYRPPTKYSKATRIGNWSEEWDLQEIKQHIFQCRRKQYIRNKDKGDSSASLTYSKDGCRRFGDHVMLFNGKVEGFLVTDIYQKLLNTEQSYNLSVVKNIHACARSVFVLQRANYKDGFKDNVIHYGQHVHIRINPLLIDKPIFLYSEPSSINRFSKVSRLQQVILMLKQNYSIVWSMDYPDPNMRLEMVGQPIKTDDTVLIKHEMTNQWLAADNKTYENTFGQEFEVMAHNFLVHSKSQNLVQQKRGTNTIDTPNRSQTDENLWLIMGASSPEQQFNESEIKNNVVNRQTLEKKIKHLLTERGIYGIRFLHKIFRALDREGRGYLDESDFRWGVQSGKIHLTEEEVNFLVEQYRGEGQNILYTSFMKDIRGKINQNRQKSICDAYTRITKVLGGDKVTAEEIGKIYDAKRHPEVVSSKKSEKEAFNEFIWSWDTVKPGYQISLNQFASYFEDISAIIPRDEHFEYLLLSVFHL